MMREKLKKAYEQNGSLPVAFLDETYRTAEEAEDGLAFYVVTAILIRPAHFESIRGDLQDCLRVDSPPLVGGEETRPSPPFLLILNIPPHGLLTHMPHRPVVSRRRPET